MSSSFVTVSPSSGEGKAVIEVGTQENRSRSNIQAVITARTTGGASAELVVVKGNKVFVEVDGFSETVLPINTPVDTIPSRGGLYYLCGVSNSNGLKLWYKNEERGSGETVSSITKIQTVTIIKPNGVLVDSVPTGVPFSEDYGLDGEYKFYFPIQIQEITARKTRKLVFFVGDLQGMATDSFVIEQQRTE